MDHYDDENFDDGFDEEALAARMKLDLWKKLFAYVREYPRDLTLLGTFAFTTACADISFPLITRAVVDDVSAHGAEASLPKPRCCPGSSPTSSAQRRWLCPSAASSGWAARSVPT